jgi:hypothetical protein
MLLAALLALVLVTVAAVVVLHVRNPRPHGVVGWLRAQDMPHPRGEVASAMDGATLVVAGGLSGLGRTSRDVSVFDLHERQWTIGSPLPQPRHHAAAAALDGWVYVTGGASSITNTTPRDTVWRARPGERWQRVAPMPEGRAAHAMVAFGGKLYVFGGVGRTNRTLIYNPTTGWKTGAPIPAGRDHLRAAVWNAEIWVVGGRTSHLSPRVDVYDPAHDVWHAGPALPQPMSAMAVGVLGDELHVIGGENPALIGGRVLARHFVLPPGAAAWQSRPAPALAVHGAGFGVYQNVLILAGGAARPGAQSVLSWTGVTLLFTALPQLRF